ncbi:MAG: DegT/DnrJ/EryC1/StrS family aminotransferase [Lachnospiraceae bacterium]|nr:DegT/DnrJ/EryC1/StrS family aminotransferase [Lachnospiraceae bacterium]
MEEKILVTRSSMPPLEEFIKEIEPLWESHFLTNMGEKHKCLETELKKYLGVSDISLMVNGHLALELAIQAMNLSGEVITTPYTFASTTHAIVRNGLTPVFCDIDEKTFTIDADKIEGLITEKTSAIIPVHVYGNICDVEKIQEIADRYNLKVIYDAAHAFGEEYNGIGVGNFGDASMFSFHATKVFNTIEGGAVTFKDSDFGLDLYRLKNFGIRGTERVDYVGTNAKMNEFQAAMGLCNLRHITEEIEKRRIVYEQYVSRLSCVKGIRFMELQNNVKSNYAYFPVIFNESKCGVSRDRIHVALADENIISRKYFYPITNSFECYQDRFDANETPIALDISKRVLTLPIYADLDLGVVDKICDIILNECKQ